MLFVLVLRKLPDRFERRSSPLTRGVRVAVAVAVGADRVRLRDRRPRGRGPPTPVSTEMIERALPEATGATSSTSSSSTSAASTRWARSPCSPPPRSAPSRSPGPGAGPATAARAASDRRRGREADPPAALGDTTIDLIGPSMPGDLPRRACWRRCTCCSPGTTIPAAGSSAGSSPAPAIAVRYIAGGIDEVRRLARCGRGRSSAPACCIAVADGGGSAAVRRRRRSTSAKWELDLPRVRPRRACRRCSPSTSACTSSSSASC